MLGIPLDESHWSPRLRVYFKAVEKFHARPKETPFGTVMVTNLSSFPSALTVVPVPDGNVRKHRQDFIVNEDLKRMGCSGRSALSLSPPADASQTKFHQLFRTSDRIPFYTAVIELVRLCQIALTLFEQLKLEYADGLLCDITERGIYDWWMRFGTEFYNVEPSDGILGPTTVAALLGMVLGARNRLSSCGAPVPKDAFDISQFKKAIYHFQRQQRIPRTRRLDRQTMDRLQRATMKNGAGASGDIFAVPRAIKSTVVDLGGRAVGSTSNKVEGSAVETTDIEKFVQHLTGDSCKFLWQGKQPKKSIAAVGIQTPPAVTRSRRGSIGGGSISEDEQLARDTPDPGSPVTNQYPSNVSLGSSGLGVSGSSADTKDATGVSDLRKAVFKTMTGRMKDVASGISAGADYVRGRGHHHHRFAPTKEFHSAENGEFHDSLEQSGAATPTNVGLRLFTGQQMEKLEQGRGMTESPTSFLKMPFHTESPVEGSGNLTSNESGLLTGYNSLTGSVHRDLEGHTHASDCDDQEFVDAHPGSSHSSSSIPPRPRDFQRTKSFSKLIEATWEAPRHEEFWPRRLSFSLAEEAVLTWDDPTTLILTPSDLQGPSYKIMKHLAEDTPALTEWINRKLTTVESLQQYLTTSCDEMHRVRDEQEEIVQDMRDAKRDVLERQAQGLREAVREVEAMGARMQYELGNVRGKMSDVEDAVRGFERSVEEVEEQVGLEGAGEGGKEGKGWWSWIW